MTRSRTTTNPTAAETAPVADDSNSPALPSIRFTTYLDPRSQRPSLTFSPVSRTLPTGVEIIRVGRYSERDGLPPVTNGAPSDAPIGFKSKVVSRRHCEFWFKEGHWYIRDVKSSSGTFLNHIRLSPPATESRPFAVNDGDIVQLGIDFKGGEEVIFRCVKMRLELNRDWQTKPNPFNLLTHNKLRAMAVSGPSTANNYTQDCSICLNSIAPCQSLFVAPCSHTWHYKCVRTLLLSPQYPIFICPNCRATTDLETDPEEPDNSHLVEWQKYNGGIISVVQDTEPGPQHEIDPSGGYAPGENDANADEACPDPDLTALSIDAVAANQHASPPVPIPGIGPNSHPAAGRGHGRSQTPNGASSGAAGHEGPITPRNNAGPWVFDGGAGRQGTETLGGGIGSLDGAMDVH